MFDLFEALDDKIKNDRRCATEAAQKILHARKLAEDTALAEAYLAEKRRAERLKERDTLPYSDEAAQEICERIAIGELLINICKDDHLPTMRQCKRWLNSDAAFNALYQSAINDRLDVFEEQVVQIADDLARDFRTVVKNGIEEAYPFDSGSAICSV
jgi:hypothetical protein